MTTEDGLEQEMELAPDFMEIMTEDGVEQEMEMVPDSITSESLETEKGVSSVSLELAPDSMEMVPDSLPPGAFVCGRCHLVHEDREAWNRAHSWFYPCPRCGLVHADYLIDAMDMVSSLITSHSQFITNKRKTSNPTIKNTSNPTIKNTFFQIPLNLPFAHV